MIDPPKKLSILFILEILKRETNHEHHISQQDIIEILARDYHMKAERKSIARNINDLREAGYEIGYDEGYYLESREFEYSELRLLIDSVLFSKNIPANQRKSLLKKVANLTDRHFNARVKHIATLPSQPTDNFQIFYTIELIEEAISDGKMLSFLYNEYHTDKKLHPKREKRYKVSPYQIAATNGRYYLICCTDKYDNIAHYRIDHMESAEVVEEKARPITDIKGLEYGLDLPKHMAEHIYMFSGESKHIRFRAKLSAVDQIIDWFGTDIHFENETEETVDVTVTVNEDAMFYWLMQYGNRCEALYPPSLRNRIKDTVTEMAARYSQNPPTE